MSAGIVPVERDNQDNGYFYMPYPYLTDAGLADDFWVIRLMED